MAFGMSFFEVPTTLNHATFIGADNFVEAFRDTRFINSLLRLPTPIRCVEP